MESKHSHFEIGRSNLKMVEFTYNTDPDTKASFDDVVNAATIMTLELQAGRTPVAGFLLLGISTIRSYLISRKE